MLNANEANVVQRTTGSGLESAYIEWESVDGATGYNVYIRSESTNNYEQLDNELIRQYKNGTSSYWRADAIGLKAGQYIFKIVPILDGNEDTSKQFESQAIAVQAHDSTGFAWVNGETTGAYNIDGTIKENANIIYITEGTKNTVSLEVQTSSNGNTEIAQGLQNILDLYKKGYEETPLVIRFIGKVTDPSTLEGGDIVISGNGSDNRINCGITLEGIGEDATLYGYGIRIKNATNVEIRNIAIMLTDSDEGDNIGLQQENDHIWVHNCDFFYGEAGGDSDQAKGDGALDCKKSTYVTFSYNHFFDTWIDKEAPETNINYETINNGDAVRVTIQSNEELKEIEGWTLSEDRLSMSKTYNQNKSETIQISDLAGNIVETNIEIETISENEAQDNEESDTNTIKGNTNNYKDDTVVNKILPDAGISITIKILIAVVLLCTLGFYIRYKYLKNIMK